MQNQPYTRTRRGSKLTEAQVEQIRERWRSGEKRLVLALDFDVSEVWIWKLTRGVPRPCPPCADASRRRIDPVRVLELTASGVGHGAVAERLGVARRSISMALTRYRRARQQGVA